MKKGLLAVIVIGVMFSLFYQPARATFGTDLTPGQVVATAFEASGAQLEEVSVQGWAKINESFLSVAELKDLGQLVAGTFNRENMLPGLADWQTRSGEAAGQRQVELSTTAGEQRITILLQSLVPTGQHELSTPEEPTGIDELASGEDLAGGEEQTGETYLVVTSIAPAGAEIVVLEYQAANAFSPFQPESRQAVLYKGQLPARYDGQEKNQLVDKMLAAVRGKKVEGIEEDFLVSYSNYTPLIPATWWTGSREINLQIGIRDHSDQNKTVVYVGYPLILTGY